MRNRRRIQMNQYNRGTIWNLFIIGLLVFLIIALLIR